MRRVNLAIVALGVCLATVPASASAVVPADVASHSGAAAMARPASSATQVILRPRTPASMVTLQARVGRDGARVVDRSSDGRSLLVQVPVGRGAAEYAQEVAAAVPTSVAEPLGYVYASAVPTDPDYPLQWGSPAINAPAAWDRTRGDSGVVVAVIDSGVDLEQPDLAGQIVPGGWDYVTDDAVPDDVYGHGTHVAGIVAAAADNGVLGSGTAPGCRILPMRVLDSVGAGNTLDLGDAIIAATDLGADVINLSLGSAESDSYVSLAVDYALSRDVVVVAAAGNVNPPSKPRLPDVQYPAREPGVISVGAVQLPSPYTIAAFSQDGASLDVVAPGAGIYSTVIGSTGQYWSGTSMATPFVAGTAALMRSAEPAASQSEIALALTATAVDMGAVGRDDTYGHGLIRADAAIEYIEHAPFTAVSADVAPAASGWYRAAPQVTLTPDEPATTYYSWDGGAELPYGAPLTAAEGQHTLRYRSVDGAGNAETTRSALFKVDTVDPTVPADLAVTATTTTSVGLSWSAASDATSGMGQYQVYRDGVPLALTTSLAMTVSGLVPETTYTFTVTAIDVAGNESTPSSAASATTPQEPPSIVTTSLATATLGRPYSAVLAVTGGTPIVWGVTGGSLPPGLSLELGTGTVSGTPSVTGTFAFTVRAENAGGFDTQALSIKVAPVPVPVYRFYNRVRGTHFFTDSVSERDMVIVTWPDIYDFEGVAYTTNPANNAQPLHRFYNRVSGSHFYTASADEAATIMVRWPTTFAYDGLTYSVNAAPVPDSVAVYRFYNQRNGSHFYTTSSGEVAHVIATWPDVYLYEGPAFWIGQ